MRGHARGVLSAGSHVGGVKDIPRASLEHEGGGRDIPRLLPPSSVRGLRGEKADQRSQASSRRRVSDPGNTTVTPFWHHCNTTLVPL
jgi:hypothetical protein